MEARGCEQLPIHAIVIGKIYSGGATAQDIIASYIFDAAPIAMRWGCGADPGFAAVIGEDAIFFLQGISGEIATDDDEVLAAMEGVVVFNRDGIGAGGSFALEDGQIDRLVADK